MVLVAEERGNKKKKKNATGHIVLAPGLGQKFRTSSKTPPPMSCSRSAVVQSGARKKTNHESAVGSWISKTHWRIESLLGLV